MSGSAYFSSTNDISVKELVLPHMHKKNLHSSAPKYSSNGLSRDLWFVVREGSVADVDVALSSLKKIGANINSRNTFGLTPLHIATWRNHVPIVRRLLAAGADPNARDGESGWSSLHRALHFGHLAVASVLLQSGASITLEDLKSRTPVDLLSGPVFQAVGDPDNSAATEVFSWGSGVNYQLGTGNAHMQKLPCKVDSLHGSFIKLVSAAKFHSVAVSAQGVYTWGFGRGGRLGHPDFDIHSGQAAVITPRLVTSGLGSRCVVAVAAAKHHTVVATEGGEVFTWGSNREGQLGYTSVDTQPTPRRVSSLKPKIVSVAAANKHTTAISESGEVFTWGCNKEGQLGYGTSNSASNYTPRLVEYLKGRVFIGVAAAKYHTIVLGVDGEVFTWGHRLVTPRRVVIARNLKKAGSSPLKFHRKERLHVVSIAAGTAHSMALTSDGALFYWVSPDPDLRCQQLCSLCGRTVVSISAGKYWSAAVTATGDVFMWDGKETKDEPPVVTRLHGLKRATSVSVGETHLLLNCSLYHPVYLFNTNSNPQKLEPKDTNEFDELDEDFMFNDRESSAVLSNDGMENRLVPSLKALCEKAAAEYLVEPRNAVQLLEIADSLEANDLKKHCQEITIRNLDYILTFSANSLANTSLDILANLEKLLDLKSSESWSHRRLPTPTTTFPVIIDSEEEDSESEYLRTRDNHNKRLATKKVRDQRLDSFLQPYPDVNQGVGKQIRALRKKLQQIEMLEQKRSKGQRLDDQQMAKLQTKAVLESSLAELGVPTEMVLAETSTLRLLEDKENKKVQASKKQRRRIKQMEAKVEAASSNCETGDGQTVKGLVEVEVFEAKQKKGDDAEVEVADESKIKGRSSFSMTEGLTESPKDKIPSPVAAKKKGRKGGLSMFLNGALDDVPKDVAPPPPATKLEGPAWGGARFSKGSASFREIQDEQKNKVSENNKLSQSKDQVGNLPDGKLRRLGSFLPSNPIAVVSAGPSQMPDADKGTPPWSASDTPPLTRPSLRDIQLQQQGKHHQGLSHSPMTRTSGFCVATGLGSPSDSPSSNRWFKPEVEAPSSIRLIQIEEKAIQDLKRFYTSVKIVKNQS